MVLWRSSAAAFGSSSSLTSLQLLKLCVRHMLPSWFIITMGTGSMAVSIHAFPYRFPGQEALGLVVWGLNVALFVCLLGALLGRAVCYPSTLRDLLEQPNQALFLSTMPMSLSVITAGLVGLVGPRAGPPALAAGYALAWANVPLVLTTALIVPWLMFSVHDLTLSTMTALWLLPVLPSITAAAVAGTVGMAPGMQHDHAIGLLQVGLCLLAVGFPLAFHLLTLYLQRLVCHSLPPREVIVSSFIPVGAMGMAGMALVNLAGAADLHFRAYYFQRLFSNEQHQQAWLDTVLPTCMAVAGVAGFCLWALAGWWLVTAVFSVAQTVWSLRVPWNLGWWGAVFPTGTFATTALAVAHVLHSPVLTAVGAATCCVQLLVWLFMASMTIIRGSQNELFHPPCLSTPLPAVEVHSLPPEAIALEAKLSRPPNADLLAALAPLLREGLAASLQQGSANGAAAAATTASTTPGALRAHHSAYVPAHIARSASIMRVAASTHRAATAYILPPAASLLLGSGAALHLHSAGQPQGASHNGDLDDDSPFAGFAAGRAAAAHHAIHLE